MTCRANFVVSCGLSVRAGGSAEAQTQGDGITGPDYLTLPQIGGERMREYPFEFIERHRYDAFCKTVLRNEAISYLKSLGRRREKETEFSALPQAEMDKLCTLDVHPSDSFLFSAFGYDLPIQDEFIAGAFASLPEQEQQILILHCVPALCRRRDRQPCGNVTQRRPAPQDKGPGRIAEEIRE